MEVVREGAAVGKLVLGICNGAQILVESGLVPGTDGRAQPTGGLRAECAGGKFRSTHVHVKLVMPPARCRC